MPVRILHIVTNMRRGGLETMIMNYYRHVDRNKIQFDFLVHRDYVSDYDAEILSLGGKIHRLPRLNPFSPTYLRKLDSFFIEHPEYRIVHCHLDCMAGLPLKYAKKHGVPVRIGHAHSSSQDKNLKYPLKLIYKRHISQQATDLFACSEAAGSWMFCGAPYRVINNAIDTNRYSYNPAVRSQVRQELGIEADALVLGHVGRFDPAKNHAFLIRILSQAPCAKLLLVGDGDLHATVEEQARELGVLDRVIFTGVRSDVDRLLQAMDVFLLPSLYEGLPLTVIEAQSAGLPCLISDGVPIECKKTDLVTQIPLDTGAQYWAETASVVAQAIRVSPIACLRAAGFDILENAAWLTEFYLSHHRKKV